MAINHCKGGRGKGERPGSRESGRGRMEKRTVRRKGAREREEEQIKILQMQEEPLRGSQPEPVSASHCFIWFL